MKRRCKNTGFIISLSFVYSNFPTSLCLLDAFSFEIISQLAITMKRAPPAYNKPAASMPLAELPLALVSHVCTENLPLNEPIRSPL
jgi:hypothetical protein